MNTKDETNEDQRLKLSGILASCERFVKFCDGWDSYGAKRTTIPAVMSALAVVADLLRNGLDLPAVVPTSDGGTQLEWNHAKWSIEAEIEPSGAMICVTHYACDGRVLSEQSLRPSSVAEAVSDIFEANAASAE